MKSAEGLKPLEIIHIIPPGYIHATINKPAIDRATALHYLAEMMTACADVHCNRLLIERNVPSVLGDTDIFETIEILISFSKGTRIAFVNTDMKYDEAMQYAVNVGIRKGGDYEYFNDRQPAVTWLFSAEPHSPIMRSVN